ncbi:PAAR domain-containing protein [Methanosarcina horonobensis]|nr:PAAR domain-containing protein [Methanosarcina horonobensis]
MQGSPTVLINNLPAARQGDMVIEAGPPNAIIVGCPTVLIG